jgi:hypothetical protein
VADWRQAARRAAKRHSLDPDIFERQINQESGFNPNARSPAGAQGIAQIMPGTAKGWGVDPLNPSQALDAAARNMAAYVRKYGSYENALRAYNAGPGNIKASRGFSETNNYVASILSGQTPKGSAMALGAAGSVTPGVSVPAQTFRGRVPTFDQAGYDKARKAAIVGQMLARRNPNSQLLRLGVASTTPPDPAAFQGTRDISETVPGYTTPGSSTTGLGTSVVPKGKSKLLELFWQGKGGIDVKNGQKVPQGFVSGHQDHVHVAAGPKTTIALGKLAQDMGLHVGENPAFGKVNPVHVQGSYHYKGEAIDVSGDPALMRRYARRVAQLYGIK